MVNHSTARDMARALNNYAMRAERGHSAEHELLAVYNAGIAFEEDGDFLRGREILCAEMGWDETGKPLGRRDEDRFFRDSACAELWGMADLPTASESTVPAIGGR